MSGELFGIPVVVEPALRLIGVDLAIAGDRNVVFLMRDGKIIEVDLPVPVRTKKHHEGPQSVAAKK